MAVVRAPLILILVGCVVMALIAAVAPLVVLSFFSQLDCSSSCASASTETLSQALATADDARNRSVSVAVSTARALGSSILRNAAAAVARQLDAELGIVAAALNATREVILQARYNAQLRNISDIRAALRSADVVRRTFGSDVISSVTAWAANASAVPPSAATSAIAYAGIAASHVYSPEMLSPTPYIITVVPAGSDTTASVGKSTGTAPRWAGGTSLDMEAVVWQATVGFQLGEALFNVTSAGGTIAGISSGPAWAYSSLSLPPFAFQIPSAGYDVGMPRAVGPTVVVPIYLPLTRAAAPYPRPGFLSADVTAATLTAIAPRAAAAAAVENAGVFAVFLEPTTGAPTLLLASDGNASALTNGTAELLSPLDARVAPAVQRVARVLSGKCGGNWLALGTSSVDDIDADPAAPPGSPGAGRLIATVYGVEVADGADAAFFTRHVRVVAFVPERSLVGRVADANASLAANLTRARQRLEGQADDAASALRSHGVWAGVINAIIGIGVLVVSVIGASSVAAAAVIPLRRLARVQSRIKTLELDGIDAAVGALTFVTEVRQLQVGFLAMVVRLVAYRRFLPAALLPNAGGFEDEDAGDEAESPRHAPAGGTAGAAPRAEQGGAGEPHEKKPDRPRSAASVSARLASSSVTKEAPRARLAAAAAAALGEARLERRRCAMVVLVARTAAAGGPTTAATGASWYNRVLGDVELAVKAAAPTAAILPAVGAAAPGELVVAIALNAITPCANAGTKAIDLAVDLRDRLRRAMRENEVTAAGLGVATGQCGAGAVGTATSRWICVVGRAAGAARALATLGADRSAGGDAANVTVLLTMADAAGVFTMRLVDMLAVGPAPAPGQADGAGSVSEVFEVEGRAKAAMEEWMYELEEVERRNDPHANLSAAVRAAAAANYEKAVADLAKHRAAFPHDAAAAALSAAIADPPRDGRRYRRRAEPFHVETVWQRAGGGGTDGVETLE